MRQFLLKNSFLVIIIAVSILSISGCENKYNSVIDSTNITSFVKDAVLSPSIVNTDSLPTGQAHKVDDLLSIRVTAQVFCANGLNETSSVRYTLVDDQFSSNLSEGFLKDDGISPDIKKSDSLFTGYVDFQIYRVVIGNLYLKLWSENTDGSYSNVITLPFQINRANHKPVISNLVLADSVNSDQTSPIEIKIKVVDPDGQDDIRVVYRVTQSNKLYKLSGSQGDSIFTETFSSIPPVGTYRFRFFALDQSYDSSEVLIDTIVIK